MDSALSYLCVTLITGSLVTEAVVLPPDKGFHLVVNGPELGRHRDALYIYAFHYTELAEGDEIEFTKPTGLPSDIVRTGIVTQEDATFGCYLRVAEPRRRKGIRYGTYKATLNQAELSFGLHAFTKPKTALLDTRGIYTVTIFPESEGSSALSADSLDSVGVKWTPGCWAIKWCKGEEGVVHKGARMKLNSIEQAGVYTLRRGARGARGWFVQIEVIGARCPENMFWNGACTPRTHPSCRNGGVVSWQSDGCTCPPSYSSSYGRQCDIVNPFVLGYGDEGEELLCGGLEGGNPKCRGYLFCLGDLYGCSCGPGWYGNNCDKPCPKGKYGVSCSLRCPPEDSACDRFYGPDN